MSGTRVTAHPPDNVPALLCAGEYVVRRGDLTTDEPTDPN